MARIVVLNLAWMFPLFLCEVGMRDTSANAQEKGPQPWPKNLQVLKDVPPDQLIPAMQFMSASLGSSASSATFAMPSIRTTNSRSKPPVA